MQASHCLWQALLVACQAAEAGGPSAAVLDHPAAWEQHEAPLGRQFDDHQVDPIHCLLGF